MDRIGLDGMVFYGYHGVNEEEKRLGQRFTVDVTMAMDVSRAGESDRLEDTVNYAAVYRTVKEILEGPHHDLIESLAEETAHALLERFPIQEALVRVSKPDAPIKGSHDRAWVEVVRKRSSAI